jgi:hypothetical protein
VCGDTAALWLSYSDQGTRIEHGTVDLGLDPIFSFISSIPQVDSVVGDHLWWSFDTLHYFEVRNIRILAVSPNPGQIVSFP